MPICEFSPNGSSQIKCKQPKIVFQIAANLALPMADVTKIVCEDATEDQRPLDCHAFNDLQVNGARSSFAALDPSRLP